MPGTGLKLGPWLIGRKQEKHRSELSKLKLGKPKKQKRNGESISTKEDFYQALLPQMQWLSKYSCQLLHLPANAGEIWGLNWENLSQMCQAYDWLGNSCITIDFSFVVCDEENWVGELHANTFPIAFYCSTSSTVGDKLSLGLQKHNQSKVCILNEYCSYRRDQQTLSSGKTLNDRLQKLGYVIKFIDPSQRCHF